MKFLLRQLFSTLLFLGVGLQVTAATVTWDGGAGTTNWTDAMNWDTDALPTAADVADLDGNTVVLSANTTVQRVYAGGSSDLTIDAGVTLTITGFAGGDDGLEIQGSAIVTNNGTIDISNITGAAADGLYVKGTFMNAATGTVAIDGTGEYNIYVQGGNFTNNGTITLTNFGVFNSGRDGITLDDNGGTPAIFNNNGGTITITMTSGDDGIYVNDGSIFNNAASIDLAVGAGATTDESLFVEDGSTFNNLVGGVLMISSGTDYGIQTKTNANVTNAGTITIEQVPDHQIWLDVSGSFNNSGIINLNNSASGKNALYVTDACVFTNAMGGQVNITNSTNYAIQIDANSSTATVENNGTITITGGSNDGIRLQEAGVFTNNVTLNITNAGDAGIQIDDNTGAVSTFNNNGMITITNSSGHGMEVFGTFNNNTGATYKSISSGDDGIRVRLENPGTVNNSGTINAYNSAGNDVETDAGATFTNTNATFNIGDTYGTFNIKKDFNLGSSTVTFDIGGTTAGTDYDQLTNQDNANTLTISSATMHLNWGTFFPVIGNTFTVIAGSGTVSGPFTSVTSSNAGIGYTVDYSTNTDEVVITVISLPVEMTYFKGNATVEGNLLQWETASELINEGFEVQKSTDGENWEVINFVEGNGTSIEVNNYSYLDVNNTSNINYYRLKQIDFDGAFDYSKMILITNEGTTKATVRTYPNPVTNQLTIEEFKGMVTIYNLLGQPLKTFNIVNDVTSLPLSDLENGQYFIEMTATDGTRTVRQIVKN